MKTYDQLSDRQKKQVAVQFSGGQFIGVRDDQFIYTIGRNGFVISRKKKPASSLCRTTDRRQPKPLRRAAGMSTAKRSEDRKTNRMSDKFTLRGLFPSRFACWAARDAELIALWWDAYNRGDIEECKRLQYATKKNWEAYRHLEAP